MTNSLACLEDAPLKQIFENVCNYWNDELFCRLLNFYGRSLPCRIYLFIFTSFPPWESLQDRHVHVLVSL